MTEETWYFFGADEPIRCPARLPDGRTCNRAQDKVGPSTAVRVRVQWHPSAAQPGSLLRVCRACETKLEVSVAPTTSQRMVDA